MPSFVLHTNVSKDKVSENFLKEASAVVAKTLGKPDSYVAVHVIPDQLMIFGGTNGPCALVRVFSIGALGVDQNKKHSAAIATLVEKHLGVTSDRMYIDFHDADKAAVGFSGTTFHDLL